MPLYWKVFLINGTVLCAATLSLVLAPVSVSRQVVVSEVLVLTVGLGIMLLANALVLRSSLAPVDRVIREMKAEQTTSNARALAAQEAERHRIAQELHDEVGQNLTVVLLGLKQVEQRAPADIAAELALLREATRDGLDDVRRVARQLRPGVLEDLGLISALASLANDFAEHSGASVRRVVAPGLPQLSGEAELVVYRVAQEALTNAARHAHAEAVVLSLTRAGDRVLLEVTDDGHGFDATRDGAGLRGMRERATLVAGDLTLSSTAHGTTVRLAVPVAPA